MKYMVTAMWIALTLAACGDEEATDPGQTPPPSVASVAVTPSTATLVSFGETVQLTASAQDAGGTAVSGKTFSWSSSDPSVATVSSTGLVSAVANGPATVTATTDGISGTSAIAVNQEAAQLAFTVQPRDASPGTAIAPPVEVAVQDALGNLVVGATDAVTVAIGTNPTAGTLSGTTTVNAVAGIASFSNLSIDPAGTGYTLVVSSGSLSGATSAAFDISTPVPVTVILASEALLDGYVIGQLGSFNSIDIRTGNFGAVGGEKVYRGFMSFDLSGIPTGATVQSIQFRFFQVEVLGDPYGKLGELLLKHVDYGSTLDLADFDIPELDSFIPAVRTSPNEWYTITAGTVVNWIQDDLNAGRTRFQVRLRFSTETDDGFTADYSRIEPAEDFFGTGNVPELSITYLPR